VTVLKLFISIGFILWIGCDSVLCKSDPWQIVHFVSDICGLAWLLWLVFIWTFIARIGISWRCKVSWVIFTDFFSGLYWRLKFQVILWIKICCLMFRQLRHAAVNILFVGSWALYQENMVMWCELDVMRE